MVEKDATFGGTCLNVGCIPSKALLHASELFRRPATSSTQIGIRIARRRSTCRHDEAQGRGVDGNVKGVVFLFKKNKVDTFRGLGRIAAPGKVEVTADGRRQQIIEAKNIVIATGSDVGAACRHRHRREAHRHLDRRAGAGRGAGAAAGRRRRRHRAGAGLGVAAARHAR